MVHDSPADPRDRRQYDPEGVQSEAWKQTLEDMEAIAEERRDDGWDVVTIMAAHTDTVSRDMGEEDTFGLFHVVPNNYADKFTDAYDSDEYTEYLAYGTMIDGFMFVVTELIDPDGDRSILIASRYDMTFADGMVTSAEDEGVLYTHVRTIDGTILGTFEHEEYEPLISPPHA
ncbi:DUF7529 family protein [Halopiger xanaduensis]|uniref:Uncharacterized protein n=1 Tax=Halopiger xanaduensis (strain DSM 18323 / JCM 14033 / SH-6) TaxID=797210 RepID=F8DB59_HALXS|nr:hypothetical protein [Halopiger xanaduensis]AEH38539.1 hypothetical protein Halxa_3934 [Halopiger xanaduensis SH-6]